MRILMMLVSMAIGLVFTPVTAQSKTVVQNSNQQNKTMAEIEINKCNAYKALKAAGWLIHPAERFDFLKNQKMATLKSGIESGTIVKDIHGTLINRTAFHHRAIYLKAETWEDKTSPREEMFDDFVIMRNAFQIDQIIEIRWYQDSKKQLVFNPKYVYCMNESIPFGDNTLL